MGKTFPLGSRFPLSQEEKMARIESQAKAGFYPTPDSVCELLKSKITYEDNAR